MQGGKNRILPKETCKPVLLGLSLARNLVKPLMFLYGTEWRERGYGSGHLNGKTCFSLDASLSRRGYHYKET